MPDANGAGDLPLDEELTGVLTIKNGLIQDNPRRGLMSEIAVKVSDGYAVLRARVTNIVRRRNVAEDFVLYFRRTKNAVQSNYQEMTEENFEELLRARWAKITRADVDKWAEDENKTPQQKAVFEFFVYKPRERRRRANQIQRATQARIADAMQRLTERDNQNDVYRGPIERNHVAVVNARRPDEEQDIVVPNDNTTRQARRLDQMRVQLQAENEQAAAARNAEYKPITIELNGVEVQVRVKVASLREALGLPQHNLIHNGIYHGYNHDPVAPEEDQEDEEHAQPQVGAVGA